MSERPELCVGAVAVRDGALLLIERGRPPGVGQWTLPGGRVERGEGTAAAIERELFEETGLRGTCGRLVGWVDRISADHHFVILDFAVSVDGDDEPVAGDDAKSARWINEADLASIELVAGLWDFLAEHDVLSDLGWRA